MAIRYKNLDPSTVSFSQQENLGDVTATLERSVFAAPYACVVQHIDVYSQQALTGQSSCQVMAVQVQLASASGSTLQRRSTSQTTTVTSTNDINANERYRLTPSANNSLSTGQLIEINFSAQGTGVLSQVLVAVTYRPSTHRETR